MGADGIVLERERMASESSRGRPCLILRFGHHVSLGAYVSTAPKWPGKPVVRRGVLIFAHSRYRHDIRILVDLSEGQALLLLLFSVISVRLTGVVLIEPGRMSYGLCAIGTLPPVRVYLIPHGLCRRSTNQDLQRL